MIHRMRAEPIDYDAPRAVKGSMIETVPTLCTACGVPLDSQYFDDSSVTDTPGLGMSITLARFELPPQYCGVLEYFAQFTDQYAENNAQIETAGIEWLILVDGSPLAPYLSLNRIINPWGEGAFPIAIRLQENAKLKFVARNVGPTSIKKIGGRLLGRFWYNAVQSDALRRRY